MKIDLGTFGQSHPVMRERAAGQPYSDNGNGAGTSSLIAAVQQLSAVVRRQAAQITNLQQAVAALDGNQQRAAQFSNKLGELVNTVSIRSDQSVEAIRKLLSEVSRRGIPQAYTPAAQPDMAYATPRGEMPAAQRMLPASSEEDVPDAEDATDDVSTDTANTIIIDGDEISYDEAVFRGLVESEE